MKLRIRKRPVRSVAASRLPADHADAPEVHPYLNTSLRPSYGLASGLTRMF